MQILLLFLNEGRLHAECVIITTCLWKWISCIMIYMVKCEYVGKKGYYGEIQQIMQYY